MGLVAAANVMFHFMFGRLAGLTATFLFAGFLVLVVSDVSIAVRDGDVFGVGDLIVQSVLNLLSGDMGVSRSMGMPVANVVVERLWLTLTLAVTVGVLSTLLGAMLGLLAGLRPGTFAERLLMLLFRLMGAAPPLFVGMMLMLVFAGGLHWLPPGGFMPFSDNPGEAVRSLILPVAALTFPAASILAKSIHDALTEAQDTAFLLGARSRGMTTGEVLYRHSIRHTLPAALNGFGRHLAVIVAAVPVIEAVFYLPGLGRLALSAVMDQDIPLLRGATLALLAMALLASLIGSLTWAAADREAPRAPRVRGVPQTGATAVRSRRGMAVGGASAAGVMALAGLVLAFVPYTATQTVAAAGPFGAVETGLFPGLGRDLLLHVAWAALGTLKIVGIALGFGILAGVPAGLFSVRERGLLVAIVKRGSTFFSTVPALLMLLACACVTRPDETTLTVILALVFGALIAKLTGSAAATWLNTGYVDAARMAGLSRGQILLRHVAPHLGPLLSARVASLAAVGVLGEVALSFVGVGASEGTLGALMAQAQVTILQSAYPAVLGGVAAMALVVALNLFADGMRRTVDPEIRWRGALNGIA